MIRNDWRVLAKIEHNRAMQRINNNNNDDDNNNNNNDNNNNSINKNDSDSVTNNDNGNGGCIHPEAYNDSNYDSDDDDSINGVDNDIDNDIDVGSATYDYLNNKDFPGGVIIVQANDHVVQAQAQRNIARTQMQQAKASRKTYMKRQR